MIRYLWDCVVSGVTLCLFTCALLLLEGFEWATGRLDREDEEL